MTPTPAKDATGTPIPSKELAQAQIDKAWKHAVRATFHNYMLALSAAQPATSAEEAWMKAHAQFKNGIRLANHTHRKAIELLSEVFSNAKETPSA